MTDRKTKGMNSVSTICPGKIQSEIIISEAIPGQCVDDCDFLLAGEQARYLFISTCFFGIYLLQVSMTDTWE
jgi:hypothetical protein